MNILSTKNWQIGIKLNWKTTYVSKKLKICERKFKNFKIKIIRYQWIKTKQRIRDVLISNVHNNNILVTIDRFQFGSHQQREKTTKNLDSKNKTMNFDFCFFSCILIVLACRSLGLTKIKTPPGHHRKRLAVESSRHHSRPDDSHMFIIKLPPNPYYYANSNTAQNKNGIEDKNQKVSASVEHILTSTESRLNECYWVLLPKLTSQKSIQTAKHQFHEWLWSERISAIW